MFQPVFLGQIHGVSQGAQWWTHHIRNTQALAQATFQKDEPGAVKAIMELWSAVKSWERLTGSPVAGVLMGEHTILAKQMIDCLAAGGDAACAKAITDSLLGNVAATRKLFPRDPDEFADLFGPHTELAGAYVTDLANGDQEDFTKHWAQALENGGLLAQFTDQVFFRQAHR